MVQRKHINDDGNILHCSTTPDNCDFSRNGDHLEPNATAVEESEFYRQAEKVAEREAGQQSAVGSGSKRFDRRTTRDEEVEDQKNEQRARAAREEYLSDNDRDAVRALEGNVRDHQSRKSLPTKVILLSGTQKVKIDRGSAESFDEKAGQADEKAKEYRRQRRTALMTMQISKAKLLAEKAATAEKIAEKSRAEAEKIRQNPSKRYKHQKVANYLYDNGYSSGEIDLMTKYGHHPKRLRSYSAIQLVYKQGLIPQSPESKLLNEEQERTKNEHDSSVKVSDRDIDAALRGIPTESTQHLFDSGKLKKNQDMIDFYNQSRDLWANPEERHRYDRKEDGTYELKPEWKAWKQGTGSKPKEVG